MSRIANSKRSFIFEHKSWSLFIRCGWLETAWWLLGVLECFIVLVVPGCWRNLFLVLWCESKILIRLFSLDIGMLEGVVMGKERVYVFETGICVLLNVFALWIKDSHCFLNSARLSRLEVLISQLIAFTHRHDELLQINALLIQWLLLYLALLLSHPLSFLWRLILVAQHCSDQLQLRVHLLAPLKRSIDLFMMVEP